MADGEVTKTISKQIDAVMNEWRGKVLKVANIVMVIVAFPVLLIAFFSAADDPSQWPAMVIYSLLCLLLIFLAFYPKVDRRIKGWILVLLLYMLGVIGRQKFSYDLWGETVNIASRMQSQGVPGKIQVTETVYQQLRDKYKFEERGIAPVKHIGDMKTYLLTGKA